MRTLRLFCFVICALSLSVNPLCAAQTVRSRAKTIKRDKSFFYRGKNGGAAKLKAARRDAAKSDTLLNPLGSSPITPQQAPANNECATAQVIAQPPLNQGSLSTTVNVADATTNPTDPAAICQTEVSRSVWYTFTPDADAGGTYFISTCADAPTATTVIDPVMSIYTASGNCTGFTEIPSSSTTDGCDDDNCFTEAQSVIQTNLTGGVVYYIVVRQFSSAALATGEADLQLRVSRPATRTAMPGQVLISEFRLSSNGNPRDDFVELYNNTNFSLNVGDIFGVLSYDPALDTTGTEPNDGLFAVGISPGVVIPPRGYYLVTNILGNSYSLDAYARGNNRRTDFDGDYFLDNQGVAFVRLESNGALTNIDSVGFTGGNNTRFNFVEGTALPSYTAPITNNASFVRRQPSSIPVDSNNNASDFYRVSTDGEPVGGIAAMLGAPGPQNLQSPVTRTTQTLLLSRFDTGRDINAPNNRVRDTTPNSVIPRLRDSSGNLIPDLGTFTLRRRFQNITGATVTRLRLRFFDLSTKPQTGVADARVIDGVTANVIRLSDGASIPVTGLKLEPQTFGPSQPQPAQPQGGGFNSSVVLDLGSGGLANAATVDVEIKFAIVTGGAFRFAAVVESLP